MKSRFQSSKQGRELRHSRDRIPNVIVNTQQYELYQDRVDIRREKILGKTDTGPKMRERVVDTSSTPVLDAVPTPVPTPVLDAVPIPTPVPTPDTTLRLNTELLKVNQELKHQAEKHSTEINQLKLLIHELQKNNKSPSQPVDISSPVGPVGPVGIDNSKLILQQQEFEYKLKEIQHTLQLLESHIHHEPDSGDPVIISNQSIQTNSSNVTAEPQDIITKQDITDIIQSIITPIQSDIEHLDDTIKTIEEDVLTDTDIRDIIQKEISTIQIINEDAHKILKSRIEDIHSIIQSLGKISSPNPTSSTPYTPYTDLKRDEIVELFKTLILPILTDIETHKTHTNTINDLIDTKLKNIESTIKKLNETNESTTKKINDLNESTTKKLNDLNESTTKKINETNESTIKKLNDLNESTTKKINEMNESTTKKINDLNESTTKKINEMNESINKKINETNDSTTKQINELNTNNDTIKNSLEANKKSINLLETELKTSIVNIDSLQSRITKIVDNIPSSNVKNEDIKRVQDELKIFKEEIKMEIQTSRQSSRNESAERERELLKEQKRILDKVLELEKNITGKELLRKASSRDISINKVDTIIEEPTQKSLKNEVVFMTDEDTKKRLTEIEEKLASIQKSTPARSVTPIQRRSQSRDRELDGHRLRDIPVFSAELRETMVIKGDSGPVPLINTELWNIIADTTAGFDYAGGYYECPITGGYNINLICKTLSTSVTLKITLLHIDSTGHIMKAYSLDQSNIINEHSMAMKVPHAEKGDRLKILVESRFNIALKGHEEIEVRGNKYPIVSNLLQIAYIPPVGFCES
jgi:hypothetical protein